MVSDLTLKKRFMNALFQAEVDRTPVLSVTQTGTVELMRACGAFWPDAHVNSEAMAKLALAAYEVVGFEAVRVPFGMYVEAESLGCMVDYHRDRVDYTPSVTQPLANISGLRVIEPTEGRMPVVIDAVKVLRAKVGKDVPLIAGVVGPFNLACFVYGVEKLMAHLIRKPADVHGVVEITWQVVSKFCKALSDVGADVIALLEPTASTIGPQLFEEFALPYIKKVTQSIECPTVLHVCGNSVPILHLMAESGAKGLSISEDISVVKAREIVEDKVSLVGNVDPVEVLLDGKPDDVKKESLRILEEGIDVLAPGCGVAPHTPVANMKAMVEAAKEYGKKARR